MTTFTIIFIYCAAINLITFGAMGIDKAKARRGAWRIPEATLFTLAIVGGSIGAIFGMTLFHHKTKHLSFQLGLPFILLVQLLGLYLLLRG